MTIKGWENLKFWGSGEHQVVEENLKGKSYCPGKRNLYLALKLTPFEKVKVCILGQDPYPNPAHAMGLAFSVPSDDIPQSLAALFKEYKSDLHLPEPATGDLTPWTKEGVLLWNAIPSCDMWKSMSHDWPEWELLTGEILTKLSKETSCIFVGMGHVAQRYLDKYVKDEDSNKFLIPVRERLIKTTHPSPRAALSAKVPFLGCRLFSTINTKLVEQGQSPVDWRLK